MGDHDDLDPVARALRALGDEPAPAPSARFADRLESSLRVGHATAGSRTSPLRRILVRPVAVLGVVAIVVTGIVVASVGGGRERDLDAVATPAPTTSPTAAAEPVEPPEITLDIAERSPRAVQLAWEADDTTTIARWRLVALREREVELIARVGRTRTSIRVPRPLEAPLTVVIQAIDDDGVVLARSNAVVVPAR